MKPVIDLFGSLWNALGCVGELLGYVLRFVSVFFRTRASLAARLLAAVAKGSDGPGAPPGEPFSPPVTGPTRGRKVGRVEDGRGGVGCV